MADDRREQDQRGAGPDGETAGVDGAVEPGATGEAQSGDSRPAPTARVGQRQRATPATSTAAAPATSTAAAPPQFAPWQPGPWQPGPWQPGPWPQFAPWQPGPWGAWPSAPAPVAWPAQYPGAWAPSPGALPIGYVPWGCSNPPAVPPVLEPPGKFHPPRPRRPLFSLQGRVSPTLYSAGLALGLPGLLTLLFLEIAPRMGWKLGLGAAPAWILVETICAVSAIGLIVSAIAQARQRRADGWRDYAGPSPFLVMGAMLAVVAGIGLPLGRVLPTAGVDTNSAVGTLLLILVYLGAYLGLVHFLAVRPGALTWRDVLRPRHLAPDPDDWASTTPVTPFGGAAAPLAQERSRTARGLSGDVLLALAMLLPILFVSGMVNQTLVLVLGLKASDLSPPVPTSSTGLDPWITIVTVAVIVPVGEEVFFRGFATNAWGRSLGRNSAILRAALFFAFVHVLNGSNTEPGLALRVAVFNFGARIPVAIALTWLYFRRRSILASGTLHASYNGLIQLLAILQT